jgi:hypothetical protein
MKIYLLPLVAGAAFSILIFLLELIGINTAYPELVNLFIFLLMLVNGTAHIQLMTETIAYPTPLFSKVLVVGMYGLLIPLLYGAEYIVNSGIDKGLLQPLHGPSLLLSYTICYSVGASII